MIHSPPHVLCINPWIHDFAAYDYWARPLGLLLLASIMRIHGIHVSYIDCLDRFHPLNSDKQDCNDGRGRYNKTHIPKPDILASIPRRYSQYGIPHDWLIHSLKSIPVPDVILLTSHMTYWYPGILATIKAIRTVYADSPIILGGIYASLCSAHAKTNMPVQDVIIGPAENKIISLIQLYTDYYVDLLFDPHDMNTYPFPSWDLQHKIPFVPIETIRGCPFACRYCASDLLYPDIMRRHPDSVVKEILYWHNTHSVNHFAIYDDAFLYQSEHYAIPILKQLVSFQKKIYFHTPNAVHIGFITQEIAQLFYQVGFMNIRLGLETLSSNRQFDCKLKNEQFFTAVRYLLSSGFSSRQIGAYVLVGLPNQTYEEIKYTIQLVLKAGIMPILAYYTPIPKTPLWPTALASSRFNLDSDPLFSNNSIFPCQQESYFMDSIKPLKMMIEQFYNS